MRYRKIFSKKLLDSNSYNSSYDSQDTIFSKTSNSDLAHTYTSDTMKQYYSVFWEASMTYTTDQKLAAK